MREALAVVIIISCVNGKEKANEAAVPVGVIYRLDRGLRRSRVFGARLCVCGSGSMALDFVRGRGKRPAWCGFVPGWRCQGGRSPARASRHMAS